MLAGDLILTASAKSYENWACQPMLPGSRERVNPSLTSASLLLPSIKPSRQPMKNAQFPMARNFGGQCSGGSRNYDSGVSVFLGSNSRSQLLASIFNLNFMVRTDLAKWDPPRACWPPWPSGCHCPLWYRDPTQQLMPSSLSK